MENKSGSFQKNFKFMLRILYLEKWLIFGILAFAGAAGVAYALSLKDEFVSVGKLLPEVQSKGSIGQFAGLAALAGVDLGSASATADAVRPDLYPDVLKSTQFFLYLFQEKVRDKNSNEVNFYDYYKKEIFDGRLNKKDQVSIYPKSGNYISFNRQTENSIKDLKERVTCIYDKKVGIISISVKMPDPVVAANIAHVSMQYLTKYIVDYRTDKLRREIVFLEDRLLNAKKKYYNIQTVKANYGDKLPLQSLRLQSADLNRERIESDYKISSTFYNTLLQKYEEAKLKLQQETPVIKILEPPLVSNFKSEPKRLVIVLSFLFVGFIILITVVLIKHRIFPW